MSNTALWDSLFNTDPAHVKEFKRAGGFSGTAIKPFWTVKRMTETFGPQGKGWGWDIHEERTFEASNGEVLWMSRLSVWYVWQNEKINTSQQWGQTVMLANRQSGVFLDEEAPKKSITDAFTKCASYIGLGGDVHLGLFNDSKYVDQRIEDSKPKVIVTNEDAKAAIEAKKGLTAVQQAALTLLVPIRGPNGEPNMHIPCSTRTAFLDAFDSYIEQVDDAGQFFDLNADQIGGIQAAAKALKTKQGDAIVQRVAELHTRIHAMTNDLKGAGIP